MFGVLVDVVLISRRFVKYLEEVPVELLTDFKNSTGHSIYRFIVINLQYGPGFSGAGHDVFRSARATINPGDAHNSNFLHPVLYYYDRPISGNSIVVNVVIVHCRLSVYWMS